MKRFINISIFLALALSYWWYQEKVDNFSCQDLYLTLWPEKKYGSVDCALSIDQARAILNQPFRYLTKGRQFYVFASQDGKYVLKFLKCQRINVSGLYKSIFLPGFMQQRRKERLEQKQKRVEAIFTSCYLAATRLRKVTGVRFVHLMADQEVQKTVSIIDGMGVCHRLDIDQVPFVLQRRAKPVLATLCQGLKNRALPDVDRRLQQLVDLVVYDAKHQVVDTDDGAIVRDNMAYLPHSAIHADIGTLAVKADTWNQEYLRWCFKRFDPILELLEKQEPTLAESFQGKMNRALDMVAAP